MVAHTLLWDANNFVICQGNSPAQVEAIAESIGDYVRETIAYIQDKKKLA